MQAWVCRSLLRKLPEGKEVILPAKDWAAVKELNLTSQNMDIRSITWFWIMVA